MQVAGEQTNLTFRPYSGILVEDAQVLTTQDFTIVEVVAWVNGVQIRAQGSSRRFLGNSDELIKADKPNKDIGIGLAYSRALVSLGKKFERQALGKSKHDDNMREVKAKKVKNDSVVARRHEN